MTLVKLNAKPPHFSYISQKLSNKKISELHPLSDAIEYNKKDSQQPQKILHKLAPILTVLHLLYLTVNLKLSVC